MWHQQTSSKPQLCFNYIIFEDEWWKDHILDEKKVMRLEITHIFKGKSDDNGDTNDWLPNEVHHCCRKMHIVFNSTRRLFCFLWWVHMYTFGFSIPFSKLEI